MPQSTSLQDSPPSPDGSVFRPDCYAANSRDDGETLPGSSKKVFLSIPASSSTWSNDEYQERFEFVTRELIRVAVENLRPASRHIIYELRMIGTSRDTATPHILIYCRRSDLEALQDLFYSCGADRLYCYRDSTRGNLFRSKLEPPKPSFKFFFLGSPLPPLTRCSLLSGSEAVVSLCLSDETLCGALVKHQGRTATVGLVLDIDEVSYLITVKHLFDNYNYGTEGFYNYYKRSES
ncbi:hypothetical protein FSARC_6987 [Fusarium sarcochroum]|uniref:Uncharacterized protein n=1 Tax=Fusarium sarcochroum TaxID=1208366 RepID=A0A8H4TWE2_9HYPO|nr:hypothetical protein FSARC_6987 [Fusarium sarcochroum]